MTNVSEREQRFLEGIANLISQEYPKFYKSCYQFARASKVDEKTIRNILKCTSIPSILVISRIANALSYDSLSEFLKKAGS